MKLKRKQIIEIQSMTAEELGAFIGMISMVWQYAHPIEPPKDSNETDRHNYLCEKYGTSNVWVASNAQEFYRLAGYAEKDAMHSKGGIVVAIIRNGVIEREEMFK